MALVSDHTDRLERPRPALALIVLWTMFAGVLIASHRPVMEAMSTDDLMRLVQIRDLIAGQGWFDIAQHRLDPPGVAMHWSRLVDLPIMAGLLTATPFVGPLSAETLILTLWPVLLLLPVLALCGRLAQRLGGPPLVAMLLLVLATPVLVHFRPGAIDHHGLQILLVLLATLLATGDKRLQPALAGGAAAASIAIGLEMLPALCALGGAILLRWILAGRAMAASTMAFGGGLIAGASLLFPLTVGRWDTGVCDAFAPAWLVAAFSGGGCLLLVPRLGRGLSSPWSRGLASLGAAVLGGLVVGCLFPQCLGDPYGGLDARLKTLWLAHVMEAQTIATVVRLMPAEAPVLYGSPALALGLAAWTVVRGDNAARHALLPALFVLAALFAVSLWQMRASAGAIAMTAAVLPAVLAHRFGREGLRQPTALLVLVLASTPALTLLGSALARTATILDPARPAITDDGRASCRKSEDFAALAALRPGRVLSLIDAGPAILATTPHAIIAAPYHRNVAGNLAMLNVFLGDDATALSALRDQRIDYVALCAQAPERANYAKVAPDGLIARLGRGERPPYLSAPSPGPLQIFRVQSPRAAR